MENELKALELPRLDQVNLGVTGLRVSRLAYGTGTHGFGGRSDQSVLGVDALANLLVAGFNHGINLWDTADDYGTHAHIAKALMEVPREKVVILTKSLARDPVRLERDIDRFLMELNIDMLDIVLLHAMTQSSWTRSYIGVMDGLSMRKQEGKVKAVGVSPHSLEALRAAADSDWPEVVMVRINYAGSNMDSSPEVIIPILERMHQSGKAIIGMKVLGAGEIRENTKKAIDFVKSLSSIAAITIGMTNLGEMSENIRLVGES